MESGQYRFGQVNEGPFAVATEDAIRRAEKLDALRKSQFIPNFLLVPAVYTAALWLEAQTPDADLLMVMPPAPKEFSTPFTPMPVQPFLAILEAATGRSSILVIRLA